MSNILEVSSMSAAYEKDKIIVDDISFELKKGEILGLCGESGSGKSTIAKAVLGLVPYVNGDIKRDYARARMIFQDPYQSLNPAKTVSFILEEPLKLLGVKDKSKRMDKVKEMMAMASLEEELLDRKPANLSGGQRQRVSILCSLMQNPDFLVADEPVSALDVTIQAQVLELLQEVKNKNDISILIISHDLRTMYHFCDRIIVLKDGKIQERLRLSSGSPGNNMDRHELRCWEKD